MSPRGTDGEGGKGSIELGLYVDPGHWHDDRTNKGMRQDIPSLMRRAGEGGDNAAEGAGNGERVVRRSVQLPYSTATMR